jgi:hypothetical protein
VSWVGVAGNIAAEELARTLVEEDEGVLAVTGVAVGPAVVRGGPVPDETEDVRNLSTAFNASNCL